MKNRTKTLILLLGLGLILLMMVGGIVARESIQKCTVYSYTTGSCVNHFTADNDPEVHWYWSIIHHQDCGPFFRVEDETNNNQIILYETNLWADQGASLTGSITHNHYYELSTDHGQCWPPNAAECTVAEGDYQQQKQGQ